MTLKDLMLTIGKVGINDKLINFSCAGSSLYEINDLTVRDYPILYISPTGTHTVNPNYSSYELTLFYIDRLLEDNTNDTDIHSTGIEVLKNIINKIRLIDGIIDVEEEYNITLFTETERLKDRCNGAYTTITISVLNDTTCPIN